MMKVFSFSSLSKLSLEVKDSALFVPTWESNDGFSQVLAQGYVACPHVLYSSTWKITNLNDTILPRQTFFTHTIYDGVAGN